MTTVRTTSSWACMDCPESGDGDGSDRAAKKHGKATKHSTTTETRPERREAK